MYKHLFLFVSFTSLFLGCKQDDITPSWLKIDSFTLTTNEATQGNNTHAITDAWVYIDGKTIGVFEVPCKIPILDEGEHNIVILPGIINNGIPDSRKNYPFYKPVEITATLVKNDTLHITPVTTYKNSVQFSYIEDFEGSGINLVEGPISDTLITFVNDSECPGIINEMINNTKCGGIFLDPQDSIYTGVTNSNMVLPKAEDVYVEVDFRTNNRLAVGVIAKYSDGSVKEHTPLLYLNPQINGEENWRKVYVDIKEDVSFEVGAVSYEIYFLAVIDTSLSKANIFIDNVKVVHY